MDISGDLNITIQTISTETIKSLDAVERLSLIRVWVVLIRENPKQTDWFAKRHLCAVGGFMELGAGSDYNETLNLWQVAMRNNLDVADQFVNKMQKAYGISTKTLMNAQAFFLRIWLALGDFRCHRLLWGLCKCRTLYLSFQSQAR